MENNKLGFSTRQIHVGKYKNAAGALCDPIYQTSTFEFDSVEQGGARFAGSMADAFLCNLRLRCRLRGRLHLHPSLQPQHELR